ncbi:hypothetical protein Dda_2496 [Drechslerella dactyloides]|uniref:DUF924-domain-containing protein n=1 Tax=Drechslerella dactyloides TaxID=74499 RepID=A0AAD6NM02_DREDA|nr:hypothetical protein Dda_2496 [Drechslerella dactyloides]
MATARSLNRAIFNGTLYQSIRDLWFDGVPWGTKSPTEEATQRWFQGTKEQKAEFDKLCFQKLNPAVVALSPTQFPIAGLSDTEIAEPFVAEIVAADNGGEESTKTALSFMILLDQIPRNLYRTKETLRLVFDHYDPIAVSLARHLATADPTTRLDMHPSIRHSLTYRMWFYMPLMHSERLADHRIHQEYLDKLEKENSDDEEVSTMLARMQYFTKMHTDIIEKFGRYPYRNEYLGRESTDEEKKWLEDGGPRFGVGG